MTRKGPNRLPGDGSNSRDDYHLIERELTGAIIGAFYECYNWLEFGYLESVYRRALVVELGVRGHRCSQEGLIDVLYKGVEVGVFRYDLLVDDRVLVEVKSGESLAPFARRQLLNYLRGTGLEVGLLFHVGPEPQFYRCVNQQTP